MASPKPTLIALRGKPAYKRYEKALTLVLEDDESISEAARMCGVSRPRLSEKVNAARAKFAEQQERAQLARAEQSTRKPAEDRPVHVQGEVRRVPPVREFMNMYFDGMKCMRHEVHHEFPEYQFEIMESVLDPQIKRLLVNCPPGHSKSTAGTVFTTVYELCRNPNAQMAILSGTTRMAQRFLRQIRGFLTDDIHYVNSSRNLIEDWGPFVNDKGSLGSTSEFWVAGRQSSDKDPSVSSYGLGQQIQGARMDRIVCDDIALRENQKNPERVQDMFEMITQDLLSRLDETGELVVMGTRVLPGDVYGFLRELPAFKVIRYPCIIDDDGKQVLWPDHFDYDAAVRQRDSMRSDLWDYTYQNTDSVMTNASFTMEQIERCLDPDRRLGDYPQGARLFAGIDPAGANSQSGYTAMVLWALLDGRRYLVDMVNHREMKAPQVFGQIKQWAQQYPLTEVRVETNGLAAQLFQYNTELNSFLANKGVRLSPHITSSHNKWDPQFGVEAMSPLYHNGTVSLPWQDIATRRKVQELIDQLLRFPVGKPDDLVMAAWFGELACKDAVQRSALPKFDPRVRVPGRVRRNRKIISFGEGVRAPEPEEEAGFHRGEAPWQDGHQPRFTNVAQGHDGKAPWVRGGVSVR